MAYRPLILGSSLFFTACGPRFDCPDNAYQCLVLTPPFVTIRSPTAVEVLPRDTELVVEAHVQDIESSQQFLTTTFWVDNEVLETADSDDVGRVSFDWRTPNEQGPVEIVVTVTDPDGLTGSTGDTFWVE